MKIILVGYPGSQKLVPASKYLVDKYLPDFEFQKVWLNYDGPKEGWSKFVADYLDTIEDKKVILTLDDYLVNGPISMNEYYKALSMINLGVKLCPNTPEELKEYPICTQYCIWDKRFLTKLLRRTTDPWNFEMEGSRIFKKEYLGVIAVVPCIPYDVHSALSTRWEGVKTDGLSKDDLKYLKEHKLL